MKILRVQLRISVPTGKLILPNLSTLKSFEEAPKKNYRRVRLAPANKINMIQTGFARKSTGSLGTPLFIVGSSLVKKAYYLS